MLGGYWPFDSGHDKKFTAMMLIHHLFGILTVPATLLNGAHSFEKLQIVGLSLLLAGVNSTFLLVISRTMDRKKPLEAVIDAFLWCLNGMAFTFFRFYLFPKAIWDFYNDSFILSFVEERELDTYVQVSFAVMIGFNILLLMDASAGTVKRIFIAMRALLPPLGAAPAPPPGQGSPLRGAPPPYKSPLRAAAPPSNSAVGPPPSNSAVGPPHENDDFECRRYSVGNFLVASFHKPKHCAQFSMTCNICRFCRRTLDSEEKDEEQQRARDRVELQTLRDQASALQAQALLLQRRVENAELQRAQEEALALRAENRELRRRLVSQRVVLHAEA